MAKQEQQGGQVTRWGYAYDAAGRLVEERKILPGGSVLVTQWSYDANGNRVQEVKVNGEVIAASSDDQDRLLSSGDLTFTHTHHGELFSKCQGGACQHFSYDVFGNLRQVVLDNGQVIEYLVDGRNRRIGKKVDGVLVQGWLYDDQLRILAELDGQGNLVASFIYGEGINVPELMEKGGRTYRLIKDQLGSVRLVVDVEDGTILQEMRYDAWGNVIFDSNPGFQPFGFAGGLYDPQTRLVRFGARDYDATIGGWTAKDPVGFSGNDLNLFRYANGHPVNLRDPLGLFVIDKTCNDVRPQIEAGIKAFCGYLDNPRCRRLLTAWGAFNCVKSFCEPDKGPCITCDFNERKWCAASPSWPKCPNEIQISFAKPDCPVREGRGLGPTLFHEALHRCGYGRRVPDDSKRHPGPFYAVVRICTGYEEPLPWWGS